MCRYNLNFSIDDQVVDVVRPKLGSDKALEAWMIRVLKKSMADFASELKAQAARKADGETTDDEPRGEWSLLQLSQARRKKTIVNERPD